MKASHNLIAGLAGLLMLGSALPAFAADRYNPMDTPAQPGTHQGTGQVITSIVDGGGGENDLVIQPGAVEAGGTRGEWLHCYGSGDPTCDYNKPGIDILSWVILPNCSNTSSPYCVKSLEVAAPGEELKPAEFLGEAKKGLIIPGDPATGLIQSGRPSLFDATNAANAGGSTTYSVTVVATSHFNQGTRQYQITDLNASIVAYKNEAGQYQASYFDKSQKPGMARRGGGDMSVCAFYEDGNCGRIQDFTSGTRFKLQMVIPKAVGGWFQGRMKDPQIAVDSSSTLGNAVTIEAEPVTVPRMAVVRNFSDYTTEEKTWFQNNGSWGSGGKIGTGPLAGQYNVFDVVDFYRPFAKDTASGVQTFWYLGTVMGGPGSPCLSDTSKLMGVVTTNAMGFDGRSPAFENGYLNYRVTGFHFMPDGTTPVQGTYDLLMSSDAARCLYGFSKAPISATVSVVGGDSNSVATTVVSEKNGWLKMAAYGFTFSQKTLSVHMTQVKAPAVKKTITCVKGKVTKKVTAINASCPAGYQKK